MFEFRCLKCGTKMFEVKPLGGNFVLDCWCKKSSCKAKNKYVIADGKILTKIIYTIADNRTNKTRKVGEKKRYGKF